MKKVKLLFLTFLIVITCTGCTVEYNINITKDTIAETINVTEYFTSNRTQEDILKEYNTWYPTYVNFITEGESIEIEDYNHKTPGVEYHNKNINNLNGGYNYKYSYIYPINKYYDAYVLTTAFVETTIQKNYDSLIIKTTKENLLCGYDYFDSLKVNITVDPQIYKLNYTNTNNIKNNTYTWTLDRTNCNDSQIILTLEDIQYDEYLKKDDKDKETKKDYSLYIFFGILIVLILIGYYIYTKIKKKNEEF